MVVDTIDCVPDEQRSEQHTDLVFQALADATRRDIVRLTMHGEYSVSELAGRYPMSFAAVQKHVAVLQRAQLVTKQRRGREQLVRCRPDTVRDAATLLDEFAALWRDRLDRFGEVLADNTKGTNK
jgi:DNA-binding transcriptional ArsR family regulator